MVLSSEDLHLTLSQKVASAGLAGCTADLLTFPLDTVKVWLQVRGETTSSEAITTSALSNKTNVARNKQPALKSRLMNTLKPQGPPILAESGKHNLKTSCGNSCARLLTSYLTNDVTTTSKSMTNAVDAGKRSVISSPKLVPKRGNKTNLGLAGTLVKGVKKNGFFSLYGGISAGLQRQAAFCAVRIGLYDTVKGFYHQFLPGSRSGKQVSQRILAGTTTAFIAVAVFQPTEVVKIRMQAQTRKPAHSRVYTSSLQAYRSLFGTGIKEAWKGVETNATRLAVVNVCELVTYDLVKELLLDYKLMKNNPTCHFSSAFISGFITTLVASPIDVIKTRYMNSKQSQYTGPLNCAKKMMVNEGVKAFYKGFVPAYLRLGTWNIVMFVSYEQYKAAFLHYNKY